jgi:hypothetical protein
LFYDVEAQVLFGAAADLCAFVRSVFYLTQATFCYADVVTCRELDELMTSGQLPVWREALDLARVENDEGLGGLLSAPLTTH